MPLQATSGAASYDAFGGGVPAVNYIEEVFSTYLYTGTGASQTITNSIDLSTKGGMVWAKARFAETHTIYDTSRGASNYLSSDTTGAQINLTTYGLQSFTTTGFTYKGNASAPNTYVSWAFRKQPKFFDIVTYTGTGSNTTIAHALGSVPACIIVKRTDTTADWQVYHRSLANTEYLVLNTTAAKATGATRWNSTTPTSTVFSLGTDATVNASGGTYVAYIFAHDAGGFGLTGTDNVISCGTLTTNGSGVSSVTLGYEPQWVLLKSYSSTSQWIMFDNMRGWTNPANNARLFANLSNAETSGDGQAFPTATGFGSAGLAASTSYIYIAIRRGPMKVPTSGTSVYNAVARTGTGAAATITGVGFPPDLVSVKRRDASAGMSWQDRLRGITNGLIPSSTDAEDPAVGSFTALTMDGVVAGTGANSNVSAATYINHFFRRAPGFFDEVCYTGTGVARTVTHNLGAVPELMIVKNRTAADPWAVYAAPLGATQYLNLSTTAVPATSSGIWSNTAPTSSVFTVDVGFRVNRSGDSLVAYLFATCAGVSKVGSYTGTGTTLQIDCGFTAGARFVLIKRTDSTGDWYVWDTARGIIAGNDPYLLLNSTAAEVTSTDYVDTYSAGFELSSTAPAAINASGGTFIFLAIA